VVPRNKFIDTHESYNGKYLVAKRSNGFCVACIKSKVLTAAKHNEVFSGDYPHQYEIILWLETMIVSETSVLTQCIAGKHCVLLIQLLGCWDSSGYWPNEQGTEVWFQARVSAPCHPVSYRVGTVGCFIGGQSGRGAKLTAHLQLVPRLRIRLHSPMITLYLV
jgi:hypothetical protein